MFSDLEVSTGSHIPVNSVESSVDAESVRRDYPSLLLPDLRTSPRHSVEHSIETNGPPIYSRPRRVTPEKLTVIKTYVSDMMEQGILRPSNSPWGSPVHLVKKRTVNGEHAAIIAG